MSNTNSETLPSKEEVSSKVKDAPFFPLTNVSMVPIKKPLSGIEKLQYDFIKQSGLPSRPHDTDSKEY